MSDEARTASDETGAPKPETGDAGRAARPDGRRGPGPGAAAEVAIGIGIILVLYRNFSDVDVTKATTMRW